MKEGALIRTLLVALPAGLLALGVGAMVMTHIKSESDPVDPNEAVRLEAAALKRRPVNPADLARDLATLSDRIGDRHSKRGEGLEGAAFWLESTLGGGNIGYVVERQEFEAEGKGFRNLIAELPGKERRREIILVGVVYDTSSAAVDVSGNDGAVVALLSIARALTGEAQERSVRFAAFSHSADPTIPVKERGAARYAHQCRARGENVVATLFLDFLGEGKATTPPRFVGNEESFYLVDSAKGAFHQQTGQEALGQVVPSGDLALGAPSLVAFQEAGIPAVSVRVENETSVPDTIRTREEALAETVRGLEAIVRVWANP